MIVVMGSGEGTNFQALAKHVSIDLVITNNKNANIVNRAKNLGIKYIISKDQYESYVPKNTKLIILAGFMKILSPNFVDKFKIVNIHPSLLPSFRGIDAIGQALDAGVKFTGCTVHWVDKGIDTGKIIDQLVCQIDPNDNKINLQQKIQQLEHKIYPAIVKELIHDKLD